MDMESDTVKRFRSLMGNNLDHFRDSTQSIVGEVHSQSGVAPSPSDPSSIVGTVTNDPLQPSSQLRSSENIETSTTIVDKLTSVEHLLQDLSVVDPAFTSHLPTPSTWAKPTPKPSSVGESKSIQSNKDYQNDQKSVSDSDSTDHKLDLRIGEVAAKGSAFAPFKAVTKYCYSFVSKEYTQPLASAFWDAGKIWNRNWDLFYVNPLVYPTSSPVLLVPEQQLLNLLDECKKAFPGADLTISDELREEGLILTFDFDQPQLRPYYLGLSDSRSKHDYLVEKVPNPYDQELGTMSTIVGPGADRSLHRFKEMIALAQDITKKKNKARKSKSKAEQDLQKQQATNSLLQAQRYLGLALSQAESTQIETPLVGSQTKPGISSSIDTSVAVPYTRDKDVVLIAIDLEAWEHNTNMITEIGIATLDTRDLDKYAPGRVGEDWQKVVRGRHFRILEHKDKVNVDFVQGCPDKFEFGDSEFIARDQAASVCTSCFHPPFSAMLSDDTPSQILDEATPRNIVLVGHDIGQDIEMCKKLGFSPTNRGNLLAILDTATLYRAYRRDPNPKSLGGILSDFDIAGWNLHNAGNDAVYTLWSLMAMCISASAERGTEKLQQRLHEDIERRTLAATQQAHKRVQDEVTGWEVGESDDVQYPSRHNSQEKPVFGPERPPVASSNGLYTIGGAPLDV